MNQVPELLREINDVYLQGEKYTHIESVEQVKALVELEGDTYQVNVANAIREKERMLEKLRQIKPQLTVADIANGYRFGSRTLRSNLSSSMINQYHETYLPIMLDAIKANHDPAYRFLAFLRDILSEQEFSDLLVYVIRYSSGRTRDTAFGVIEYHNQLEMLPILLEIPDPDERLLRFIEYLKSKST